jgi:DNA segregation ATPase FtsK/SpoIIIE, S-DNA-T family
VAQAQRSKSTSGRTPTRKHAAPSTWSKHRRDLGTVGLGLAAVVVVLSDSSALGPVGHGIELSFKDVFGLGRWLVPVLLVLAAWALATERLEKERWRFAMAVPAIVLATSGLAHFIGSEPSWNAQTPALARSGGWVGVAIGGGLRVAVGSAGAIVILAALLFVALLVLTGVTLAVALHSVSSGVRKVAHTGSSWWSARPAHARVEESVEDTTIVPITKARSRKVRPPEPDEDEPPTFASDFAPVEVDDFDVSPAVVSPLVPKHEVHVASPSSWTLPSLDLLQKVKEQRHDRSAIDAAGDELVSALAAHGVDTTLVGYTVGPTVTRYELELGLGVKVARVTSLHRDIAYAMASPDVRILAPIPGRSAIGVEVPNRQRTLVTLGDLLASDDARAAVHPLDVPMGRDIAGQTVIVNLADMPHVLISGATGAGKSSCINSLITSLVMRATPDQVRLILIDPKRVELGQYNDLPHLLSPVVVDPKKAAATLTWAVREMERRYDILAEHHVRDIVGYQQMLAAGAISVPPSTAAQVAGAVERGGGPANDVTDDGPDPLPYIVVVVDELNDLMMVAARDVEDSVVRIAQMARAVGIHLVLATQRPSVDVITGVIKANIPSRMAFAVSSLADSRVILDQAGAERLIGKGDVLLLTASSNVARRLQCPWVSEEEVRRVVQDWRAQGGTRENVVAIGVSSSSGGDDGLMADEDDEVMLARARELVLRTQSGSVSNLQRRLRIGFARAGRLMDELELEGIVAPGEGPKSRRVLKSLEEYEATSTVKGS